MNRMLHFHSRLADNKMRTFCNPIMIHVAHKSPEWGAQDREGKTIYRIKWAVGLLWCFTVEFPLIENNQRKWIGKLLTSTWLRTPFVRPPTTHPLRQQYALLRWPIRDLRVICKRYRGLLGWFCFYATPGSATRPSFLSKARLLVVTLIRPLLGRGRLFNLRKFPGDDTLSWVADSWIHQTAWSWSWSLTDFIIISP